MIAEGPQGGPNGAADRIRRPVWRLARRFGPLILVLAAVIAAFASGLTKHLSLHELRTRREGLEAHPSADLGTARDKRCTISGKPFRMQGRSLLRRKCLGT